MVAMAVAVSPPPLEWVRDTGRRGAETPGEDHRSGRLAEFQFHFRALRSDQVRQAENQRECGCAPMDCGRGKGAVVSGRDSDVRPVRSSLWR
jgi:hypothetical protein